MSRAHLTFPVEDAQCVATIDAADGRTGLLIVSGGNEIRSGPAGVHARLAARLAAHGFPVFRYDRRGIGESEGNNAGFRESGADLAGALAAFRKAAPHLDRVVAFGNCDAASLLMLESGGGADALALGNPWTFDTEDAAPHALRAHYRNRLKSGSAIKRVLRGEVNLVAALKSLIAMLRPAPKASGLAAEMRDGLARFDGPVAILIAGRDRTGQQFRGSWPKRDKRLTTCAEATHAFVEPESLEWLEGELLKLLESR